MKPENRSNKTIFISLVLVVAVAGVLVANATMHRYEVLVKGILGLTALYSLTRLQFSPMGIFNEGPIDYEMKFSKYVRFLVLRFLLTVVIFWALQQVLGVGKYLMNILANN